jgi:hypothetical protein
MEKIRAEELLKKFNGRVPVKLKPMSTYISGGKHCHYTGKMLAIDGDKAIIKPSGHKKNEIVPLEAIMEWQKGMHMAGTTETATETATETTTNTTETEDSLTTKQQIEIMQSGDYLVCSYDKHGNIVYWDGFEWRRNHKNAKKLTARGSKQSRTRLTRGNRGNGIFISKYLSIEYGVFKLEFDNSVADVANVPPSATPAAAAAPAATDTAPAATDTAPAATDTAAAPAPAPAPEALDSTKEDLLCDIQKAMEAVNAAQAMYMEEKSKLDILKMRFELIKC